MSSKDSKAQDGSVALIVDDLRKEGQFSCVVESTDEDRIGTIRALGRQAGRVLGWKVRTFVSDPSRRDDGLSLITIVVVESNPIHEQLMQVRGQKAIRRWMQDSSPKGND